MNESIIKINGTLYKSMLLNAAASLNANIDIVNDLNVFPIPDGDTGENMFLTLKGGIDAIKNLEDEDISIIASKAGQGMLLGARGNSGVILSQLFYGISLGLQNIKEASLNDFAKALEAGIKNAYSAVAKPVEGTILTVAKEASEFVSNHIDEFNNFNDLFEKYESEMKESLKRTPDLLKTLKDAGVVDSGGAGLVYIAEGFTKTLKGEKLDTLEFTSSASQDIDFDVFDENSEMVFGYCTEVLLRLQRSKVDIDSFNVDLLIDYLSTIGDSIVAFKTGSAVKIHVHTLTPYKVLEYCQKFGEYLKVKIENMTLQHNETIKDEPKKNNDDLFRVKKSRKQFAVVTVASGKGLINLFEEIGADYVISGGQTNNPSSEDFVEAFDEVNADYIFVLPNNSNIILAAKQAGEMYKDSKVIVVESKTIGQGYSAISMIDYSSEDPDTIKELLEDGMKNVATGIVSIASRDTVANGIEITKNHYLGFTNKNILTCQKEKNDALYDLLNKMNPEDMSFLLLVYGKSISEEEKSNASTYINNKFPLLDFYEVDGEQEVYDYILIME